MVLERDQPQSFDVARFFSDPDGNRLDYPAATNEPLAVGVSVTASEITPTPLRAGTAAVTVIASDPADLSASQTFTVTVEGGNPPAVSVTDPGPSARVRREPARGAFRGTLQRRRWGYA